VKKSLRKLEIYVFYKQLIYINKSKFNYTYLQHLKNYLQVLFNKNIEFNFIDLKHFYLNSNILSESILLKITKNRKKLNKFLNKLENIVKIRRKVKLTNRSKLNTKFDLNSYNSELDLDSYNFELDLNSYDRRLLQKDIINNLEHMHISGFRLEAKGRLSRRYTASRSVYKLKYKGNLLNVNSSYRGLSSVMLRGNLRSSLQYTKLNSKSRIGSFGIKG
jgi:hypothetical protein